MSDQQRSTYNGLPMYELRTTFTVDPVTGKLVTWWVSGDTAVWTKAQIASTMVAGAPRPEETK